jgi:hypothetical protein
VFNRLFVRSDALTRQLSAALADERRQYLTNCEDQGMSRSTLRSKARMLIRIADYLKLLIDLKIKSASKRLKRLQADGRARNVVRLPKGWGKNSSPRPSHG